MWHHHYGKIAAAWALAFLVPFAAVYGADIATFEFLHVMLLDYVPFIVLLFALYTISGGVYLKGDMHGTPWTNTGMLAGGTAIASITGTTGASVLLIRPLIRANDDRSYNVHVVVFFIFLVSNIGGSLTPLGDPPLYLGFLKGVDFFWPTHPPARHDDTVRRRDLARRLLRDRQLHLRARQAQKTRPDARHTPADRCSTAGATSLLLAAVIAVDSGFGDVEDGRSTSTSWACMSSYPDIVRVIALLVLAALSLMLTPIDYRDGNDFTWGPIAEVAKLFAGIFVTIVPVIAMLRAGTRRRLRARCCRLVTNPDGSPNNAMYFWLTGGLSSFLDNAPTYLVFFNAAGGDPQQLMGPLATTLAAISAGAVFMGANTYIGNAPNFMVKAIAEEAGIKMPSFFGYMLWSRMILLPCFALVTWLHFL